VDIVNISTALFFIFFTFPKMHYQKHYLKRGEGAISSVPSPPAPSTSPLPG
jgi:hypothetical protein